LLISEVGLALEVRDVHEMRGMMGCEQGGLMTEYLAEL
jgi:hypothetical protein